MAINRDKVVVVGAGAVGSTIAFDLVVQGVCDDLALIDLNPDKAWAQATDLQHSLAYTNRNVGIQSGGYELCRDADIVVIAAALPFQPGQTRLDMAADAARVVKSIVEPVMLNGFTGIFIVITNPVDVMTYYVQQITGLPAGRVIGTGTALDSARLKYYIAEVMKVDPQSVQALCLGEHGDSQVIPWSLVSVGGKKFLDILEDNKARMADVQLDTLVQNTAMLSYRIMSIKGATTFGIAATTVEIIRSILRDENRVIPVSARFHGEYGFTDVCAGVPAVIGSKGVVELVEYRLPENEREALARSIGLLRSYNAKLPL